MTTVKPTSRPPIKREHDDEDSHPSSVGASETNAKRTQKGANPSRSHHREQKVSLFPNNSIQKRAKPVSDDDDEDSGDEEDNDSDVSKTLQIFPFYLFI
jgi:hypothetical protein